MKKFLFLLSLFTLFQGVFATRNYHQEVLNLVNKERTRHNLTSLHLNNKLNKVAKLKSNDMSKEKYFSHNSKKYGSPFDMMKKEKIKYKSAAENIAKGQKTSQHVFKSWMESKGHRKNILNPRYTEMGVGKDDYQENIWTQVFIGN